MIAPPFKSAAAELQRGIYRCDGFLGKRLGDYAHFSRLKNAPDGLFFELELKQTASKASAKRSLVNGPLAWKNIAV